MNKDQLDELAAAYIDGSASETEKEAMTQLMCQNEAWFRDTVITTQAVAYMGIKEKEWVEEETWEKEKVYAEMSNHDTDYTEYTEMRENVMQKYPEISLKRFYPEVLLQSKWKSFNGWIFVLPIATMYAMMFLQMIIRDLGFYNRYIFDPFFIASIFTAIGYLIWRIVKHNQKVKQIGECLENQIDYIEENKSHLKRIIKNGKFGLYDAAKHKISITPQYDYIHQFQNGKAKALKNKVEIFIDQKSGKEII